MAINQVDGFEFIDNTEGKPLAFIVKGIELEKEIDYIKSNQIKSIYLNEFKSSEIESLEFLKEVPHVEIVNFNGLKIDYGGLYNLKKLRNATLSISKKNQHIDFSKFEMLEGLAVDWYNGFQNLSNNKKLKELSIWNYKPKDKLFSNLELPVTLEILELIESNINTLKGMQLPKLIEFQAHFCRELQSVEGIDSLCPELQVLVLDHCKKLSEYSVLAKCNELKKIILGDCGDIPNLKWLRPLRKVNHFSFWGTNLQDGDTSYCEGIDYVNFKNKNHYSNKVEEFKKNKN